MAQSTGFVLLKTKNEPYQSAPGAKRQSLRSAMHTNHGGASEKIHVMSAMAINPLIIFSYTTISRYFQTKVCQLHSFTSWYRFPSPTPAQKERKHQRKHQNIVNSFIKPR